MTVVKICGVTTIEDALMAARAGADMLGLNFYRRSSRYIEPDAARALCAELRAELGASAPLLVGVFVNELVSAVSRTMERVGLHYAQLSGDESVDMLRELRGIAFKSIRPAGEKEALDDVAYFGQFPLDDDRIPSLLVDAHHPNLYGGTGAQASLDVALAVKRRTPRLMLAGGLTPDNVAAKVRAVRPWGVDVASGVEVDGQPGRKDADRVRAFIQAVRAADGGGTG